MNNINCILSELKSLDLSVYPIEKANALLAELRQMGLLITVLNPGNEIYRMRLGIGYRTAKELSYKPEEYCEKCQRANLRGETIFYGIIGNNDERQTASAEYVGMCECSNLLWDTDVEKGSEELSCGRWLVKKSLRLVSIVHPFVFKDIDNPLLNTIIKDYKKNRFNAGFDMIQEFFCHEFSKPVDRESDYNYLISALITKRLISEFGFDGVIYPSQRAMGKVGLNVALSKTVIDNGKIELVKILELKCYRYKMKMTCINMKYVDYPSMNEQSKTIDDKEVWKDLMNEQ